jgi:peptidoglycan hydrolase CwlO-like protein
MHMRLMSAVIVALLAATALPVTATAASSAALRKALAAKRAQAEKVGLQIAAATQDLTNALAQQSDADLALEGAREEVANTTSIIQGLDLQIQERQTALDTRAVAMYTGGSTDMLAALLSVNTLDDLFTRLDLFTYIQQSDTDLVSGLNDARSQSETLQQQQALREAELIALRQQSDARASAVKVAMAAQQRVLDSVSTDIRKLVVREEDARAREAAAAAAAGAGGGSTPSLPYDPNNIISESQFLASSSMDAAAIQGFLSAQGSRLKSYTGSDHTGKSMSAAQMIADAAVAWRVNPKVILVTLQKEQSLINGGSSQRALDWAMGCGKMDSRTISSYKGFGNQIWGGARALAHNRSNWHSGISLTIDGSVVHPASAATFTLYRYTPHFHGNTLFWKLYWHYFGDPTK